MLNCTPLEGRRYIKNIVVIADIDIIGIVSYRQFRYWFVDISILYQRLVSVISVYFIILFSD